MAKTELLVKCGWEPCEKMSHELLVTQISTENIALGHSCTGFPILGLASQRPNACSHSQSKW